MRRSIGTSPYSCCSRSVAAKAAWAGASPQRASIPVESTGCGVSTRGGTGRLPAGPTRVTTPRTPGRPPRSCARGYRRFGNWKDVLVAYNAGPDAVHRARREGIDPDRHTTGGDYGRDVIARAAVVRNVLPVSLPELIVTESRPAPDWAVPLGVAGLGVIGILLVKL